MRSTFNKKKYLILFILILILALPNSISAQTKNLVNIYFFHSKDCTHCNSEIKFLDTLEKKYNNIKIYRYEVHNQENNQNRLKVQDLYNLKSNGVPLTIIGDTPYIGYTEESSNLKYVKTIEYYSRYGYQDRVGELLQIKTLSTFPMNEAAPTLEQFMENYGNYKLIGKLYTNDIDISSAATILGVLSQFNILKIMTIILVILFILKKANTKSLVYIVSYLVLSNFLTILHALLNYEYATIIASFVIIIYIAYIILRYKNKPQKYLSIFILIISLITSTLENNIYLNPLFIFKELLHLHNLTGLNKINYYCNYIFASLIINIIFILLSIFITIKHSNKIIENKNGE